MKLTLSSPHPVCFVSSYSGTCHNICPRRRTMTLTLFDDSTLRITHMTDAQVTELLAWLDVDPMQRVLVEGVVSCGVDGIMHDLELRAMRALKRPTRERFLEVWRATEGGFAGMDGAEEVRRLRGHDEADGDVQMN